MRCVQVSNQKFCSFGWEPVRLDQGLFDEVVNVAAKYKHRVNKSKILPSSFWNSERKAAAEAAAASQK
jgi:UDP-sulfoquinovose synthase